MQRLNIPMRRNVQTTRRSRWVVWLLIISISSTFAFACFVSTVYLTRDSIYSATPDTTVFSTRFFIKRSTAKQISSIFSNIPIISDRSLTLSDLNPYLKGEFVIFISESGEKSFAARLKLNSNLTTLLNSNNITLKQLTGGVILLSKNIEPVGKKNIPKQLFPRISTPNHQWMGEIITDGVRGNIFLTKDNVEIKFSQKNKNTQVNNIFAENMIGFLSTPSLPIENSNLVIQSFSSLVSPIFQNGFESFYSNTFGNKAKIILTRDQKGVGFLVVGSANQINNQIIETTLKSIIALNSPKIENKTMEDRTEYKEIIADPESISTEQITMFGSQIFRVSSKYQTFFAGIVDNSYFLFTNRESLIKTFKEPAVPKQKITCFAKHAFLSLSDFSDLSKEHSIYAQSSLFQELSQHFSKIGVVFNSNSTIIHLCN